MCPRGSIWDPRHLCIRGQGKKEGSEKEQLNSMLCKLCVL